MKGSRGRTRVTLADVAETAGVSMTTASFVLSGRTDMRIATSTVDRVLQAARMLDYTRPPRVADTYGQGLPVIGLISDTVASDHFAGDMIRGGVDAAAERGCAVVTAETEGDRPLEARVVDDLLRAGVEHFVYAAMTTRSVHVPSQLTGRRTVLLNCVDRASPEAPSVVPDERAAGTLVVETLVGRGHRDRIWVAGEVTGGPYAGRERYAAISSALRERGVTVARHVVCRWWPPESRRAMTAALGSRRVPRPTAVIAMNDRVAMGVYQAAATAGIAIPEDLSVISFDNSDLSWWLSPELTTVGLPYHEMGRRAVEVLLDGPGGPVTEILAMPLHDRASVGPPHTA